MNLHSFPQNGLPKRFLLWVTRVLTLVAGTSIHAGVIYGPEVNPANGHTYYVTSPASWAESEATAVALGGHLANLHDAAENQWVFQLLVAALPSGSDAWIGLTDTVTEGQWLWVNGEPGTFLNFESGVPTNDALDHAVLHQYGGGSWADASGDATIVPGLVEVDPLDAERRLWEIGVRSVPPSYNEFSIENGKADPAPGKVTRLAGDPLLVPPNPGADDDFYLAGNFPAGFNALAQWLHVPNDEPASAWERALTTKDRTNRVHLVLGAGQVAAGARFRLSFGFAAGGSVVGGVSQPSFGQHQIALRLRNASGSRDLAAPVTVTGKQEFAVEFLASDVGAVAGPNTLEFERIGPIVAGTSHYVAFDYVKLEQLSPPANQPPAISLVPTQEVIHTRTLQLQLSSVDDSTPEASLTYWKVSGPVGLTVSPSGLVEWTPWFADALGNHTVEVAVADAGLPVRIGRQTFVVTVMPVVNVSAPSVLSDFGSAVHPIRVNGTALVGATIEGDDAPYSCQWYRGAPGDTSSPVGSAVVVEAFGNEARLTTPRLSETTSYWVRATNSQGVAGDSAAVTVVVEAPGEVLVPMLSAANGGAAGYPNPADAGLSLYSPDQGYWSPGAENANIVYKFDFRNQPLGASGYGRFRVEMFFWDPDLTESLGAFRIYYTTAPQNQFGVVENNPIGSDNLWTLIEFEPGISFSTEKPEGVPITETVFPAGVRKTLAVVPGIGPGATRPTYAIYGHASSNPQLLGAGITGFRLEAVKTGAGQWLAGPGPGRGNSGSFKLYAFQVINLDIPPGLPAPRLAAGSSAPLRPGQRFALELDVPPMPQDGIRYEWYEGESGDVSKRVLFYTEFGDIRDGTGPVLTFDQGLPESRKYWVRVSNVSGTSDSPSFEVPIGDLSFQVGEAGDCTLGEVLVPVWARSFNQISSFQGSIRWDPAQVAFIGVEPGALPDVTEEMVHAYPGEGRLGIAWWLRSAGTVTLPEGEHGALLFHLRFRMLGLKGSSSALELVNQPTPWGAFGTDWSREGTPTAVVLTSGTLVNRCGTTASGTVTYSDSGRPVSGVGIGRYEILPEEEPYQVDRVTTNAKGEYRLGLIDFINIFGLGSPGAPPEASPSEGVTMSDWWLVLQHVLGSQALEGPLPLLAADVDASSSVTVEDLRRIFLTAKGEFAPEWFLLQSTFVPEDPLNPWNWRYRNRYSEDESEVSELAGLDFKIVKAGDVNGDWGAPVPASPLRASVESPEIAGLRLASMAVDAGGRVRIPIRASALHGLTTVQFSLQWDPSVLQFAGVEPGVLKGVGADNLNVRKTAEGILAFAWGDFNGTGVSLADEDELLSVVFSAVGTPGSGSAVRLTQRPVRGELTVRGRPVPFGAGDGWVAIRRTDGGTLALSPAGAGQSRLWFELPSGGRGWVESSEDLVHWEAVSEPAEASSLGGLVQVMVSEPREGTRFFRVRVLP